LSQARAKTSRLATTVAASLTWFQAAGFAGSAWSKHLSWVRGRRLTAAGVVARCARRPGNDFWPFLAHSMRRDGNLVDSLQSLQLVPRSGKGQARRIAFSTSSCGVRCRGCVQSTREGCRATALWPGSQRARSTLTSVDWMIAGRRPCGLRASPSARSMFPT
jgi:hypothetical protein